MSPRTLGASGTRKRRDAGVVGSLKPITSVGDIHFSPDRLTSSRPNSTYLNENIAVGVVGIVDNWLRAEDVAIGILAGCAACQRTEDWLGRHASNPTISGGRLWNDKGISYFPTASDIDWFFSVIGTPARVP